VVTVAKHSAQDRNNNLTQLVQMSELYSSAQEQNRYENKRYNSLDKSVFSSNDELETASKSDKVNLKKKLSMILN
jgi:hypothetical protein